MSLFLPTAAVDRVTDITPEMIREMGASAIILDVDNTLATHGSPVPLVGTVEWAHAMRQAGLAVVIVSNNFKDRVAPFAEKYDLPFLCVAMKPLPFAYWRAARFLGVLRSQAVAVGDQVFTDVMGANVAGVKSILLRPSDPETSVSFRVRRRLEEPIRRKIERRQVEREKTDRSGKA
ncbi:YqeG family HAD IIIA-type phosphatase [Faecalispora jeddahensis]|uniref:YqeG family HAD IIIA-type phosphatase n=1 Tax=Faecalispora jeddahensis TaxID=1414721 RepID=UPI00145ACA08|nr:YqeG family HAD IIIA-type phosphatase [Faecalispora jeddahensis]